MSKITLTDLVNLQNETTAVNAINTNNNIVELAFDNTLSRDGTSPNTMSATLDMNSKPIINLPTPSSNYEPLRVIDRTTLNAGVPITVSPLPIGGTTGQVLTKNANTNFAVDWESTHYVPAGGATNQMLTKNSGTDYDTTWAAPVPNVVTNILALRALTPNFASVIQVLGYSTAGDGGGGDFRWDGSSSQADNGGTVIIPNAGGTGRWVRVLTNEKINVRWFGAYGDGGVHNDTTAVSNAMAVAIAAKATLYFPATTTFYQAAITIPDGTSGLVIEGDGSGYPLSSNGSVIVNSTAAPTIQAVASSGGNINNINIHDLRIKNDGGGIGLKLWDTNWGTFSNLIISAGGIGLDVQGVANSVFSQIQSYSSSNPALKVGNGAGTVTNTGPCAFIAGQYSIQNGTSPAIVIEGDPLGLTFLNTMYAAFGAGITASVTIDGPASGTPVGTVQFLGCHGESNFNSSANTGIDILIGNTHKFGSVTFDGGNSWGLGDGVSYNRDFMKIVAARNVSVKNYTTSRLTSSHGFDRSMFRLETTFPAAGDTYRFENNKYDGVGSMYSDANGRLSGTADASYDTTLINTLNLGTALAPASGGTGITSLGTGVAAFLTTPTSSNLAAAVTDETGTSGRLMFNNAPAMTVPTIVDGADNSKVWTYDLTGITTGTTRTWTVPNSSDTFVGKATPDTLTNKTLTSPAISGGTFTGHQTIEGVTATGATGTGKFVFDTAPTLGATTVASVNKVAITAPATAATLTIANNKTLTANNSITLAGTDATVMTFPATSATVARTDAANTFTGIQTFSTPIAFASGGTNDSGTAWTTYSPSITSAGGGFTALNGGTGTGTGTLTSSSGRFKVLGKTMFWQVQVAVNTAGNATGALIASMPGGNTLPAAWAGSLSGATSAGVNLSAIVNAISFGNVVAILKYDATTTIANTTTASVSGVVEIA